MLIEILSQEAKGAKLKLVLAALVPGLVDAALIGVLQAGVQAGGTADPQLFVLFCVLCVIQMACLRANVKTCAAVTETVLYKMRSRIADKLRRAEAQGLEQIGDGEIYNRIIQATTMISNSIWVIVDMAQSAVLIACVALRLWPLSTPAFALTVIVYGGGGVAFYLRRRKVRAIMIESQATQVGLFGFLDDLIRGGKEIRLHGRRGDELLFDLEAMASALQAAPFQINRILQNNFIIARMLLFFLLAVLVFALPQLTAMTTGLVSAVAASAIFIFVPLTDLLRGLPEYERAELAAANLHALEQRLDQAAIVPAVRAPAVRSAPTTEPAFAHGFSLIEADQVCFTYPGRSGAATDRFALGPVSITIRAGEIVFFVGGNGSGKTTLIKLLTGLYPVTAGALRVDHELITAANLQAYREQTTAVFTDFHLFKRLYGLPQAAAAQLDPLLAQLELTGKTSYGEAGFSRLELSTGQRKRLAMAVALLEDRPLYVFDEWAADQDPEFRRYYYEHLLPELKRQGKTVLAISHDDRYFHCADRVVFMDYGTIRAIRTIEPPAGHRVTLYHFVHREAGGDRWRFALAAVGSAVANTAVLALIGLGLSTGGDLDLTLGLVFVAICVGYALTYAYCVTTITRRVEAALYKVRLRLGEKIRRADLLALEQIGAARLYDLIVQQTTIISNSSWLIALGLQALVFLVILLFYILYLSRLLFFLFLFTALIALPLFHSRSQKVTAHMQTVGAERASLYNLLTDLLRGFKETRFHTRRGDELFVHFDATAQGLRDRMIQLHTLGQDNVNFMHFNMYVLMAVTVFVLPQFITETPHTLSQLSAAVLFVTGPLAILGFTVPEYERADVAATNLTALERRLEQAAAAAPEDRVDPFAGTFTEIEATDLGFTYPANATAPAGERFALGPVSITIRAGEIVFFVGGNGSGKTTLLKLLAGLYTPSTGVIRVDRRVVDAASLQAYRELTTAVFTDFHLFKRLYGLADRSAALPPLLDQLQIAGKTGHGPDGFSRLELSTGQRKRLAMAVALLEDRPLYIFDEWAADQDPEFRRYYYEHLLPELKRQGKTVLAISHDDRYFHCADRVVFMDYGAIRDIQPRA